MSSHDSCKCCEKRVDSVEERSLEAVRNIDPAEISRISISQLRDSEFYDVDSQVTFNLSLSKFEQIDSEKERTLQPKSDEGSSQRTIVKNQQEIDHVSYDWLHFLTGNKLYRAIYDYTAQDTDEVSFSKGDLIINCRSIDKNWMTGVVQRTGMFGMLPAMTVRSLKVPF